MASWMTRAKEQRLIREAALGDREAAGDLVRTYQHGVFAYILRLCGHRELAEDVVQEAFVRVLTNLDRFDPRYRFSTWLFTIARRVLLNQQDKRWPASDSDRCTTTPGRGRVGLTRPLADEDSRDSSRDAIQRALMELSVEQREVVVLFHQHDWPIWLIAEQLDLPEGTVKSHLHRARIRLRALLAAQAEELGGAWDDVHREEAWL